MLTPFDDYPIHQTPEPIAHTVIGPHAPSGFTGHDDGARA
jgi:hypothetical protein